MRGSRGKAAPLCGASSGSRREGLTLAADRRQPFGWPMTRNNARIIAKYLREAGWSEVTALRQELAASKARVQEMGRHNATEAEHFRAICRRIDDWVSIMTTGHAALSDETNSADGVVPSRAEL